MRYLSFVLSGDLSDADGGTDAMEAALMQSGALHLGTEIKPAIYEQMLRVFHQNPARLKGISDMIRRLDPEVVGDEFRQMFAGKDADKLEVTKDPANKENIQAMTGATISSRAVTKGVREAVEAVASYKAEGGAKW